MRIKEEAVTLVIGLGEVGKPLYTILKKREPGTIGIDTESASVDKPVGIMHICFPFMEANQFQGAVVGYARKYSPQVIVINSTAVPGTTRSIESEIAIPCVGLAVKQTNSKMWWLAMHASTVRK